MGSSNSSDAAGLVYILPRWDPGGHEHFGHLPRFLSQLGRRMRLAVIVEKSCGRPALPGMEVLTQNCGGSIRLLRVLELAWLLIRLRRRGYRKVFVRISVGAAFVAAVLGKPLGLTTYYWNSGALERPRLGSRVLLGLLARLVDCWVTGPESMAGYYERVFGVPREKILILYNDLDVNWFQSRLGSRPALSSSARGVFVHHISKRKGAHHLPELVERICRDVPNFELTVVGSGPYFEPLEAELARRGLTRCCRLVGAIASDSIAPYYAAADVMLMPSCEEGFPRVILEAMAAGVPFVAFSVGGLPDIVTDEQRACLIEKGRVEEFASRVVELLRDQALRLRLREAGLRRVRDFSTGKVVDMFIDRIAAR